MNNRRWARIKRDKERRRSIKTVLWTFDIPTSFRESRGLMAEERATKALNSFRRRRTVFPGGWVIKEVEKIMHYSDEDRKGVDNYIKMRRMCDHLTETIPIQIKNHWNQALEKSFYQRGICFIGIWHHDKVDPEKRVFDGICKFLNWREWQQFKWCQKVISYFKERG